MKKILLVDNYDSFTYNLAQILDEHGDIESSIIHYDKIDLAQIDYYDKILISPGPGIPSEKPVLKEITSIWGASKSILGVCLGHQALAESFGASLINLGKPLHGIDMKINVTEKGEYLFNGLPSSFTAGLYHSWVVAHDNFPGCLKITALSDNNLIMGITHTEYDIKGVQFHPESYITGPGRKILSNWLNH